MCIRDSNTNFGLQSSGATETIGQIILSAGVRPNGVLCNGQLLPIGPNTALFSLLGTTYGGNGTTNFAVPDLRAVAPNGLNYSIIVQGIFPVAF